MVKLGEAQKSWK